MEGWQKLVRTIPKDAKSASWAPDNSSNGGGGLTAALSSSDDSRLLLHRAPR